MKKIMMFSVLLCAMFVSFHSVKATEGIKMSEINGGYSYDEVKGSLKSNPDGVNVLLKGYNNEGFLVNMETGRVLKKFEDIGSSIIVNDFGNAYVYTYRYSSQIFHEDAFGNVNAIDSHDLPVGFIQNSNILITKSRYDEISAYNLESNEIIFKNSIGESNQILVGQDIAIVRDDSITILNAQGEFKTLLEFDSDIKNAVFTPDNTMLIVSTKEGVTVWGTSNYQKKDVQFIGTENASNLVVDRSNSYIALRNKDLQFRLYNFKTGDRIYTEKDDKEVAKNQLALSNKAQYLLINKTVYSGKNIETYVENIMLPNEWKTLELGYYYEPWVRVQRANGKVEDVTKGVSFHPNNIDVAYVNPENNYLVANQLGNVTVIAKYLGFEVKRDFKVVDTEKPLLRGVKNISVYANTGAKALQGMKAIDIGEGDLTKVIKVSGKFNANVPGVYKLTYTVKDRSGNKATAKRTITVKYNPSKNVYLFSNGNYSSKYLFNKDGTIRSTPTIASLVRTSYGELSSELGVEVKTTQKLTFKKLVIKSNGKTLTKSLTGSAYYSGSKNEYVIKKLTAADRKWIKNNIHANKKATVSVITKKKTINKTLTSKQAQGLLDGVLMYDYKKAQ